MSASHAVDAVLTASTLDRADVALADIAVVAGDTGRTADAVLHRWPGLAMVGVVGPHRLDVAVRDGTLIGLRPAAGPGTGLPTVGAVLLDLYSWWAAGRPWRRLPCLLAVPGGAWTVTRLTLGYPGIPGENVVEPGLDLAGT